MPSESDGGEKATVDCSTKSGSRDEIVDEETTRERTFADRSDSGVGTG
jgi:hypothetical protein